MSTAWIHLIYRAKKKKKTPKSMVGADRFTFFNKIVLLSSKWSSFCRVSVYETALSLLSHRLPRDLLEREKNFWDEICLVYTVLYSIYHKDLLTFHSETSHWSFLTFWSGGHLPQYLEKRVATNTSPIPKTPTRWGWGCRCIVVKFVYVTKSIKRRLVAMWTKNTQKYC